MMARKKTKTFRTPFASFTEDRIIGEGGAGRVYKVFDDAGKVLAVKLLDPNKAKGDNLKRFKHEVNFCQRNQYPNIIEIIDYGLYSDGEINSPFYVMPFYNTTLRKLMARTIEQNKVLIYFNQILNGIEAAHLLRVIHRDLKPENILYDSVKDKLLIADFGIARFEEEELYTAMETAPNSRMANFQYAAPEQRDRGAKVDHRADMYALGLILNEMFTGKIPQGTKYRKIGAVCPGYEYLDELVDSMLRQDAEERPISIDEIKKQLIALQNDFVIRQRISELNNRVICVTDLDDPLVADPPRLISIDYQSGTLLLFLSQPVNSMWIQLFKNPNWDNSSVYGKGPERFSISSNKAMIDAREDQVQKIVNHFKEWLPNVNRQYEQNLRREKEEAEQRRREDFQRIVQAEETRMRLLKSIKI